VCCFPVCWTTEQPIREIGRRGGVTIVQDPSEAPFPSMPLMPRFSGFTCPECRGPLYENGNPAEFRCRVGHVMSLKTLLDEHTSVQERKLYEAIVALEEGADLAERMANAGADDDQDFRKEAEQLRRSANVIRKLIEDRDTPSPD
jgi:two-component system chemotaxis response regulator CheB